MPEVNQSEKKQKGNEITKAFSLKQKPNNRPVTLLLF